MSKTIGQFGYEIIKMGKEEELPFNPKVQIVLDHFGKPSKSNMPVVSADLMSESEIDYHIQALKDDLDAVAKKAKAALRKAVEEVKS